MTTQEVADKLVSYMRQGQMAQAQDGLYGEDVVSIEPEGNMMPHYTKGKTAVAEKGMQFASMIEERHNSSCSDPIVCGKHFRLAMSLDATMKGVGRQLLEEICVYEVKDGKIIHEQFFY